MRASHDGHLAVLGILLLRPIASLMGADGKLLDDCVFYGRIILLALPCFVLQYEFQCLFAAAGKPSLGLYITLASGMTNIILDALFVAVCSWGLAGAAAATACSQFVGGVCPLIYFGRKNSSSFRLGKFRFDGRALWSTKFWRSEKYFGEKPLIDRRMFGCDVWGRRTDRRKAILIICRI